MADKVISSATVFPQDEGVGSIADGNETWTSAGYLAGLSQAIGKTGYVHSSLGFTGHSSANSTVAVDPGRAYIAVPSMTVQSSVGGSAAPSYDSVFDADAPVMVNVPQSVTGVSLQASTLSSVWLAYDTDGTGPSAAGTAYIRSDDTGAITAPSHPNVKLGGANPDDSSADTRANDGGTLGTSSDPLKSLATDDVSITNVSTIIYRSSGAGTQSIPDNSNTEVGFDSVEREDASILDADTSNNQITVQQDGVYLVLATIRWTSDNGWSDGDSSLCNLFVDGSEAVTGNIGALKIGTAQQTSGVMALQHFSSTESISINAYQNSGGSINIADVGQIKNRLMVARLG